MYEVYLEGAAERDLRRLPEDVFHRIIHEIDETERAVKVFRVRHRPEAYR